MSEYRQNPATGEWVIIAPERARRPEDFHKNCHAEEVLPDYDAKCPFCKGNEHMTKPPVYEYAPYNKWQIRVVPNIYAAVCSDRPFERSREGMHLKAGGYGIADVLIESPYHNVHMANMHLYHIEQVLRAYKVRYNQMVADPRIHTVNIFRNHGAGAGASLIHPHSQIIGTLVAPPYIGDQIQYARRAYNTYGQCVYCDMLQEELKNDVRIIESNEDFVALCPYASKSPYEVRIYPRRHSSIFGTINDEEVLSLAEILRSTLGKIYTLLKNPDYNYYIRSMSARDGEAEYYHWYVVIIPRITNHAGFELGTGIYINITEPEMCAEQLRAAEALPDSDLDI